ncbi:DUF3800 domain-containing protein [Parvibaculum sp.]|uniref:DUF3800 domain-containing protein n=1 Tax=Parvibaculum sp. TaxID=2024848 RepID=UPI003C720608
MPNNFVFADEAGNFDFSVNPGASKYFILCTVVMDRCDCGAALLDLRRDLLTQGFEIEKQFHATSDKQEVRNAVYDTLARHDFRIDATILEKRKAQPKIRPTEATFYKYAWFYHYKFIAPKITHAERHTLITAAEVATRQKKAAYKEAINDVAQQVTHHNNWTLSFPPSSTDPCLQAADYCAWAIQRKWEYGDPRSYDLIKDKIATEFNLWARGSVFYYE